MRGCVSRGGSSQAGCRWAEEFRGGRCCHSNALCVAASVRCSCIAVRVCVRTGCMSASALGSYSSSSPCSLICTATAAAAEHSASDGRSTAALLCAACFSYSRAPLTSTDFLLPCRWPCCCCDGLAPRGMAAERRERERGDVARRRRVAAEGGGRRVIRRSEASSEGLQANRGRREQLA